jgi:hypothetical protein
LPLASVLVVVAMEVALFVTTTLAFGMAAPLESLTVPTRLPLSYCAKIGVLALKRRQQISRIQL